DQKVVRQLLPLEARDDPTDGVDRLHVEERMELDPLLLKDRRSHLAHALDRERTSDRRAEVELRPVAEVPFAELCLDEERDLERRRWTLVGHAGDPDDDL